MEQYLNFDSAAKMVGFILALIASFKGLLEYQKQGAQRRSEYFLSLRDRFKNNPNFGKIRSQLDTENRAALRKLSLNKKFDWLGLFEEVALMNNSGLIKDKIAYYMFGYYAIHTWESDDFWTTVNRDAQYWALFKSFALKMKGLEGRNIDVTQMKF